MKETRVASLGLHMLELEITSRCNLSCRHCYNRQHKIFDLPLKEIKKYYNFSNKNGIDSLIISGGEALLHPYFNQLCDFIASHPRKFRLVLQTNGNLISTWPLEKIRLFDVIHISFDIVDAVRENSINNIMIAKNLIKNKIKSYIFVTVHKKNYFLIDKIVSLANKNKVPVGFNICLSDNSENIFTLDKKIFKQIEKKLYTLSKNGSILNYTGPLAALLDKNKNVGFHGSLGGCIAGLASLVIAYNGDIFPCPFLRLKLGSIFKDDLKKLWLKSNTLQLMRSRQQYDEPCGSCTYLSYCGGCRKRAIVASGHLLGSDPYCYR